MFAAISTCNILSFFCKRIKRCASLLINISKEIYMYQKFHYSLHSLRGAKLAAAAPSVCRALVCALCGALVFVSCGGGTELNSLFGVSAEAPVYTGYQVISGTEVNFMFSTEVTLIYARFEPDIALANGTMPEEAAADDGADGAPPAPDVPSKTVASVFAGDHSGGERITADILVEDQSGNTLNILVPFRTRNDRVPKLVINEVRTESATPKSEFIEIKTNSAGNLGALRLFILSANASEPVYEFPPVEVGSGEHVTVHLRKRATDNGIDETGSNLALAASSETSAAKDLSKTARDLWVAGNEKRIHKTDVIYIVDQDDKIIDALALCETEKAWNKNTAFKNGVELLAKQDMWRSADGILIKTPSFSDAVQNSAWITETRTLCRDETVDDSNTSADWYVCATSSATPGAVNNPKRHEPK
jgi:hypothetical protein